MRLIRLDSQGAWIASADLRFYPELSAQLAVQNCQIESLEVLEKAKPDDFQKLPLLVQGFYDSHMHPSWMAKLQGQIDCQKKSAAEITKAIFEAPQQSIYGFGWDEKFLACTLEDFSRELERIPKKIVLFRICGHLTFVSGRGFLKDGDLNKIPVKDLDAQELELCLKKIQSYGIDATANLMVHPEDIEILARHAPDLLTFSDAKELDAFEKLFSEKKLRTRYVKYFLDGSLGAHTAWLSQNYSDQNTRGLSLWSDGDLEASVRKSLALGYLVGFHAIGDTALDQLLDLGERLSQELSATLQDNFFHRIEHLQLCRDDQIERLQTQKFWSLGLQPSHRKADEHFSLERLGEKRVENWAYRLNSFCDAGLKLSLGSDAPIVHFDPRLTFEAILQDRRSRESLSLEKIYSLFCVEGRQNAGISAKKLDKKSKAWLSTLHL